MTSTQPSDRFGIFGGRYVPETLIPALDELESAYATAQKDPAFAAELSYMLSTYVGRPSPLSDAPRLSERVGVRVLLKREDLNHTGAHKINNTVGQVLLAPRRGQGSTAWRPRQCVPATASGASCTWARRTCGVRRSMSSACA